MINAAILGATRLKRRIQTIGKGVREKLVTREELGEFLVGRMKRRFRQEKGPDLKKWKEYSPNTHKRGPRLLYQEGVLEGAIQVLDSRAGLGVITGAGFRIGVMDQEVIEPTRTVRLLTYATVHQRGNSTTVARPYLGISRLDIKAVDSKLRRKLAKIIRDS